MKTNEIPEKIYIFDNPLIDFTRLSSRQEDNDIEYTRTDVFIENAVNFLKMLGCGFTITDNITHTNYDKEQLIEDFKKYMKGE